jgi:hypothetical protein
MTKAAAAEEATADAGTEEAPKPELDVRRELAELMDANRAAHDRAETARQAAEEAAAQSRFHTKAGFQLPCDARQEGLGGFLVRAERRRQVGSPGTVIAPEGGEDPTSGTSPSSEGSGARPTSPSRKVAGTARLRSSTSSGDLSSRPPWQTPSPVLREQGSPYSGSIRSSEPSPTGKSALRRSRAEGNSVASSPSAEGVGRLRDLYPCVRELPRTHSSPDEATLLKARPQLGPQEKALPAGIAALSLVKLNRGAFPPLQEEDALSQQMVQSAAGSRQHTDRYGSMPSCRQLRAMIRSDSDMHLRTPALRRQPVAERSHTDEPHGWQHKQRMHPHMTSPPERQAQRLPALLLQAGAEVLHGSGSQPSLRPPNRGFVLRALGPNLVEQNLLPPA